MTGGFQVNRTSLQQVARTFGIQSRSLASIMPIEGPPSVDGGSAVFDGALTEMLEAIGGLHTQMATVIAQHGAKLQKAYENYQAAEDGTLNHIRAMGLHG